jgi:hypothetical protein
MLPHTPSAPWPFTAWLHASQGPAHPVSQQRPSAQKPLAHSSGAVQPAPVAFSEEPLDALVDAADAVVALAGAPPPLPPSLLSR